MKHDEQVESRRGVRAVARGSVARCAPEEVPYFELVADDFFSRRSIALDEPAAFRKTIGFGPGDVEAVFSSAALSLATIIATGSLETVADLSTRGAVKKLKAWWIRRRGLRVRPNSPVYIADETEQSLLQMIRAARELGLSEAQAARLAEAVLAEVDEPSRD